MAPQLTAMKGLARRSLWPWMARAINSLPTPDSPSTSTAMLEAAAFSAPRSTACIFGLRVTMSLNVSVPDWLRLMRDSSSASALFSSALRSDTCRRSGPTGLTTKSTAPARIADTTLSMPPWAVCTITGTLEPAARIRASTPSPSRSGITRSSTTQSNRSPELEHGDRGLAAVDHDRLVAELPHHVVEQAPLDGIVVDDENTSGHGHYSNATVPFRSTLRRWP